MTTKKTFDTELNPNTLLIIPCCKTKISGGNPLPKNYKDPLLEFISTSLYQDIQLAREELENSEKAIKDKSYFSPAIERYNGNLYRAIPNFASEIENKTNGENQPKLIILSALYGPLHPLSLINDYELRMQKNSSQIWCKIFPSFLKEYVCTNKISSIKIYCGKSTDYNKVLLNAIKSLRENDKFDNVIRYDVVGGNSFFTPQHHGLQLSLDLNIIKSKEKFSKPVKTINI